MSEYIVTREGYEELENTLREMEERLARAIRDKAEAGTGQDTWHDELFKNGILEEMKWSRRLTEIQQVIKRARIVDPEEQNNRVQIGNGVTIEYEDGLSIRFVLDGYMVDPPKSRVSIYSPIGQALLGGKEGEERIVRLKDREITVRIKEIFPPSEAEKTLEEK